jgi:hypothetical protein
MLILGGLENCFSTAKIVSSMKPLCPMAVSVPILSKADSVLKDSANKGAVEILELIQFKIISLSLSSIG